MGKSPYKNKNVTICILDARGIPQTCWLQGGLKLPAPLETLQYQKVRWAIPEFLKAPEGIVTDVSADGLTIVFSFITSEDALSAGKAENLTFEDIINLFKRYEPQLKEILREVR